MKKFHILFILSVIFLNSCKEPEETYTYTMTGTAKTGNTRADISSQGVITWRADDYLWVLTGSGTAPFYLNFLNRTDNSGMSNTATFSGNIATDEPISLFELRLLHLGNCDDCRNESKANVKTYINQQEGTQEDLHKYHISRSEDIDGTLNNNNSTITFNNAIFKSYTSVACFDLSKYAGQEIKISWEGKLNEDNELYGEINNCYAHAYLNVWDSQTNIDGTDGSIIITNPSADTYVCFLPQVTIKNNNYTEPTVSPIENTVVTFSNAATNEVIGTVTFPNGIRSGKLYAGANYQPIKLSSRDIITETEI